MQVILESLSNLERKLKVVIPAERVESGIQKKLHKLLSTLKMPGFRSGKVPFDIVQKRYGGSVRTDVIESLIRETYVEALKQEKLNPVGSPKLEVISDKRNEPLSYIAMFEVYPEIKLADFSEVEVEKTHSELTDADVDEMLEKLRKEHVQWREITDSSRKSKIGDQLIIDFTFKVIGQPSAVDTKSEENVKFVLGDGSMWSDFEMPLYDVIAGEKKHYTSQFPHTHVDKELVGKDVEFAVTIREVCEPILPLLDDDEFIKKFGIKNGSLEELKTVVRKNLEQGLQTLLKNLFKKTIMDKLLIINQIEVPKILVENELARLAHHWQERFTSYQKTPEKALEFPRKDFEEHARRSVSLGLLLGTFIKENQIQVEQHELRPKIEELASARSDVSKVVDWYFSNEDRLMEVKSLLLEEKALDQLATKFKIIDKAMSYKDVMANREKLI